MLKWNFCSYSVFVKLILFVLNVYKITLFMLSEKILNVGCCGFVLIMYYTGWFAALAVLSSVSICRVTKNVKPSLFVARSCTS